jgi:hypothetical protein
MEFNIHDLSQEKVDKLKWIMFQACPSNDPWADMMNLHGAGDGGVDQFPLDLFSDEIERIDITFEGGEAPPESAAS